MSLTHATDLYFCNTALLTGIRNENIYKITQHKMNQMIKTVIYWEDNKKQTTILFLE